MTKSSFRSQAGSGLGNDEFMPLREKWPDSENW